MDLGHFPISASDPSSHPSPRFKGIRLHGGFLYTQRSTLARGQNLSQPCRAATSPAARGGRDRDEPPEWLPAPKPNQPAPRRGCLQAAPGQLRGGREKQPLRGLWGWSDALTSLPIAPCLSVPQLGEPQPRSSPAAGFPIKGGGQVVMGGSHGSRPPSPQGRAPPFGKGRPGNMGWGVATMAPALRGGRGGGAPREGRSAESWGWVAGRAEGPMPWYQAAPIRSPVPFLCNRPGGWAWPASAGRALLGGLRRGVL